MDETATCRGGSQKDTLSPCLHFEHRLSHTRPFCVGVLLSSLHHFLVPMLALYGRWLHSNDFIGTLPAELWMLTHLTYL